MARKRKSTSRVKRHKTKCPRGRFKSGPRKGRCRPAKASKRSSKRGVKRPGGKRARRLSAMVCRTGFDLGQFNPATGRKYKRPRCVKMLKRGKVKTHTPRKVAPAKVAKIVAVG